MVQLNLGCGRDIREGWVNIDSVPGPGVDHVIDFGGKTVLPFDDGSVSYSEGSHVLEHLAEVLPFMEELWRVTEPDGRAFFRCPYGSSDDADEDPTHVRRLFHGSWRFFGQPAYYRADYGYGGDWQPVEVTLLAHPEYAGCGDGELVEAVRSRRNVVAEMAAALRCVKPAREPRLELQEEYQVRVVRLPAGAVG